MFVTKFSEEERRHLSLLHLFQGFVDVDALRVMGDPEVEWCLEEIRGTSREAWVRLLDRAAEIGALHGYGEGYYAIPEAVTPFLKGLFDELYPAGGEEAGKTRAERAYVVSMGVLGNYYHEAYEDGRRDMMDALVAEEANLLCARRLARELGWWHRVICAMRGLSPLYRQLGRRAEWAELVEELLPDLVDPVTDGPLPGREDEWSFLNDYRVRLAREAGHLPEAERLARAGVAFYREQAAAALAVPGEALDAVQRSFIRSLAAAVQMLGYIQREQREPACVDSYEETIELLHRIGGRTEAAPIARDLGQVHMELDSVRDLDKAERWVQRSLEMHDEDDHHGRATCLCQLGNVAFFRYVEASAARRPDEELAYFLDEARTRHLEGIELLPDDAVRDLAIAHQGLGNVYGAEGDIPSAGRHCREAIRCFEQAGDLHTAVLTRLNFAIALARKGCFDAARDDCHAALRHLEGHGEGALPLRQRIQHTLAFIERALAVGEG